MCFMDTIRCEFLGRISCASGHNQVCLFRYKRAQSGVWTQSGVSFSTESGVLQGSQVRVLGENQVCFRAYSQR